VFETEKSAEVDSGKVSTRNLPKYIVYQSLATVSSPLGEFFLLQCRTRGASLVVSLFRAAKVGAPSWSWFHTLFDTFLCVSGHVL
jgi:hypothetical protein